MKKSMSRTLRILAATAIAATTFVSQAHAATISLSPAAGVITSGAPLPVDIMVSGLPGALGGFSFDLGFNPAELTFGSYSVDPATMGAGWLDLSFGDLGGTVNVVALADLGILEPALYAMQNSGGPFRIATVNFTGVVDGPFTLSLSNAAGSDFNGTALIFCTGAGCPVAPEPASVALLGTGLAALLVRRKRNSHKR